MDFKFSPNLFLEVAELDRFKQSLDSEGFRKNMLQNSILFGLIKQNNDISFLNGRVERDLDTAVGQKTIKIRALQAIDNRGLFISSSEINNIPIPANGQWYWIRIKHKYDVKEKGTVSLAVNGDLTGVGTKFTEVLRGMPNFPSRVRFLNSQYNTLEYDVLEVIDDEHAIVMHPAVNGTGVATFDVEDSLNYAVVGTFTPGVAIPNEDKYPFQYDSMIYEVVPEEIINERPLYIEGQEFYLARVKIENGDVVIQDKRIEYWTTQGKYNSYELEQQANPLIGVEFIKWQNLLSPANENEVFIAWGMRSQNWAVDSSKNIVTLFGSATGGKFKTVDDFTNGDFDGWRIYTRNGNYSRVSSSIKQGQAINLTLDVLDVDNYSDDGGITFNNQGVDSDWVLVVPDCEEVEILFTPQLDENNNTTKLFTFPVNALIARCDIEVYLNPTCLFNVKYRYRTDKNYTEYQTLPEDEVGYYTEISFDDDGDLKPTVDRVLYPYSPLEDEGYIQLTISPNSYSILIDLIYKGDKIGVQTVTDFNTIQVYELKVGRDKRYQFVTGTLSLTDDMYISLSNVGAVEGNEFRIHLNCSSLNLNGKKIYIIRDYDTGTPVIMKEISQGDVWCMMNQDGGIVFDCVFSDTGQWNAVYQNYDLGVPNQVISIDGDLSNFFDSSGLGKVKGLFGHALCDGRNNTPNLVDKFILGAGSSEGTTIAVGSTGGSNTKTLSSVNIPEHYHMVGGRRSDRNTSGSGYAINQVHIGDYDANGSAQTKTSTAGGSSNPTPIDVKNPYYALIYCKKLY